MFPLLVRAALSSKKPAASIWSLHRVLLLLPPSLKTSSNHHYHHKVSVISTETIKPSSPTPAKFTTFKLSLIDNDVPPIYVPFIFFFFPGPGSTGPNPGERRFETLRSSLAQTLTRFYPLAGRLSKSGGIDQAGSVPVVHCNDDGVPFSSATVDLSVAEFLRKRLEIDSLQQFLPFTADPIVSDLESAPQIAFRATAFPCGGLAIGVCMLHKIIDAATLADFMKLWSAVAKSEEKTAEAAVGGAYAHDRAATSLLPLRHGDVPAVTEDLVREQGKMLTRRLAFDEEAIHALKAKAKSDEIPNPTRTEAVAGFLWKHVMSAAARAASPDGSNTRSVASVAAMSFHHHDQQQESLEDGTKTIQELVHKLRSSVEEIDKEFIGKLQGRNGRQEYMRNLEALWKPTITIVSDNSIIGSLHLLIIGNLPPLQRLRQLAEKYGPVMQLQLGEVTNVIISTPEAAKLVMKTHDLVFASRSAPHQLVAPTTILYGCNDVAFAPYGDDWRQMRKVCIFELLSAKRMASFRNVRSQEISKLVAAISEFVHGNNNEAAVNMRRLLVPLSTYL
ncbi:unnamed protein product [Linum tenue]|uniref:Uncharacterized protein n=1 Tax=Linum tenue TaxID=586396 RepID=A0AAV0NBX6_9ROSI|nr:unnamed protein product [Linum tenue]